MNDPLLSFSAATSKSILMNAISQRSIIAHTHPALKTPLYCHIGGICTAGCYTTETVPNQKSYSRFNPQQYLNIFTRVFKGYKLAIVPTPAYSH